MLLELEADLGMSDEPGSLLDRVSVGTVTFSRNVVSQMLLCTRLISFDFKEKTRMGP